MKHPDMSLHIRTYDDEVKRHSHDHHQLVLPLVGTLFLSVEAMEGEGNELNRLFRHLYPDEHRKCEARN